MSIILNALRKSEQQRQLNQSQGLNNPDQGLTELKQRKTPAWLIALVVVNLFFLSYFMWFFTSDKNSIEKETNQHKVIKRDNTESNKLTALQNVVSKSAEKNTQQQTVLGKPMKLQPVQAEKTSKLVNQLKEDYQDKFNPEALVPVNTTNIANMIAIKNKENLFIKSNKPDLQQLSIMDQIKKRRAKKITLSRNQKVENTIKIKSKQTDVELIQSDFKDKSLIKPEVKRVKTKPEKTIKSNKENKIPWLSELSYEFRRTVPDIKIDVYVYSENKKDRFIMINMSKYVLGHNLGEGMMLKEIRVDSLVVEYKNKIFKIKR